MNTVHVYSLTTDFGLQCQLERQALTTKEAFALSTIERFVHYRTQSYIMGLT